MALGGLALPAMGDEPDQRLSQAVCARMAAADRWRTETLLGYSVMRRYRLSLGGSSTCAEMLLRVEFTYPGQKNLQVISQTNCGPLEDRIFHHLMNAEIQAARDEARDGTSIVPCNYEFEMQGTEDVAGRAAYVIRLKPRRKQRFLVDGKMWVDTEDAAITRLDGEVVAGSFWLHSFHMVQAYERVGPYWLVASIHNDANVRFLGQAQLNVEFSDYRLRSA